MKKTTYLLTALFAFSLLFWGVGNSYSQAWKEAMSEATPTLIGQSDIRGWDTVEASGMIGAQLVTNDGDYIGQISNLVIDSENGHVIDVILSDVPGRGGEPIYVPFAALSHSGGNIYVFNPPEELGWFSRYLTARDYGELPFGYFAEVRYLYSDQPIPMAAFDATTLMGASVATSKGEDVARVDDFVIDFTRDQVVYSVLSDVGGMEGKMVAVPFSELSKTGENAFTLHTTKEKLMDSPAFTSNDMTDLKYAESIYRYYGVQPYWEGNER
jgi:sporulation protein YlmC with PRC-barrel domain